MRAWGRSRIVGAGARRRRFAGAGIAVVAVVAIGLSVVAVSSADVTNNTKLRSVDNNAAVTSGPGGSVLAIDVEYTVPAGGATWSSTRVTDSDQSLCFNHNNHSSGTATEILTAATTPSNARLTAGTANEAPVVTTYSSSDCSAATALGTKNLSFSVIPITTNPTLAQSCGIDVVLVLDETGSIQSAGATQNVRNAAIAFANGIADTGSNLALVEFNTAGSVTIPLTPVTSSWVSGAFTTHLNTNYNPSGRTNWEAGLLAAQTVASAKLVVFITDGNPNKPGVDAVPDGDVLVMQKASDAAKAIKLAGKHLFAVGVGDALSQSNAQIRLKAVSGNNVWTSGSLNAKDVTFVTSFADLQAALKSAAESLCGRELKVTKQVDENGDGIFNDTPATQFTVQGTVNVTGGSVNWIDPTPGAGASGSTRSRAVGGGGTASFRWAPVPGTAATSVSAVETPVPAGYEQVSSDCPTAQSPAAVAAGQTVSCTIKNRRKGGKVTLIKEWVGTAGNVNLLVGGQVKGTANGAGGSTGAVFVPTGDGSANVALDEAYVVGGDAALFETTMTCTGTNQAFPNYQPGTPANVTVADNANITCTIKNTRKATLKLVKSVTNDNGGSATAGQWNLSATAAAPNNARNFSNAGNAGSFNAVFAGVGYSLAETGGPGQYTAGSWVCDGGTQVGSQITVGVGQAVTCTITNDDNAPSLTLVKRVTNDNGGTAAAADWLLSANGPTSISGQGGASSNATFDAGTYTLSESGGPTGYTAGSWSCTGGTQNGATITVTLGQSATCTIVNDDNPATLTLVKAVVNNDGGTKAPGDWSLSATGSSLSFNGIANTPAVTSKVVKAGVEYTLAETGPGGYSPSAWSCPGGTLVGTKVTLTLGANVTCTITNDDSVSQLKLVKNVTNNSGGAKGAGEWTLSATSNGADAARNFSYAGNAGLFKDVFGGTAYTLAESGPGGYAAGSWSCDGGTLVGNNVTVPLGGKVTCSITNDDQPGAIIVKKVVVNDDGGSKKATEFSFQVNEGSATVFAKDGDDLRGKNTVSVDAGPYSVIEAALPIAGYTTTYDGCSGVVGNGETKTCTITNDDEPGTIVVKKVVVNDEGGSKTAGAFSFKVGDAAPVTFVEDGQNPLLGEKSVSVAAGTHTVTEPTVAGYEASFENCKSIVVGNGETKTCTITNNDSLPPTVDVRKTVRVAGTQAAFAETASAPEASGTFEYQVEVWNKSAEAVTLTSLTDSIGAVVTNLDDKGTCSVPQTLAASNGSAGGADTYVCTFELPFSGNAGASQKDTVKATVKDDENDAASAEDDAGVSLTDLPSSITVTKSANPETIDESAAGTDVEYTVVVKNTSAVDRVTIDAAGFVDRVEINGDPASGAVVTITNLDCSPQDNEDDGLPITLDPSDSITCTFSLSVKGNAGDHINDLITVTGEDDDGHDVSDSGEATVEVTDVASTITVTKTANPTVVQDSGPVTFTIVVRNDSAIDTAYIQTLTDSVYGNLDGKGSCTLEDGIDEGPAGSRRILPGASYTCSFIATVSRTETDVVTAAGVDDDGQPVSDDDDATVTVNRTPPPPYEPSSDVTVTKAATPRVQLPQGGGTAPITYNLVVLNNGPDAAADVKVADTAPANVTFVSATTSAGTCSTSAQALDCTIASLAPGASAAITINARVSATGTKVNTVLVTTATPETNPNNNTASAQTLVTAPVTPPKAPVVVAEVCRTLFANPKVLKATGKKQKVSIIVKQGKKGVSGVRAKLTGPRISKTVKTGKNGKVKVTLQPGTPGIVKVAIQGKKACNTQRIGIVGVYEPPVTG